ncbi:MBL fold metallo-hydrolase [Paenibacillus glycanilyticus]|uniref:MBL fold metallo-hydrolase n=1 Tax=Paenibacillus glycanilyticus TaxID=126569 RepID=UPI000FDAA0F0|nr:MBL fold metallo-hydrolase [Paenibacillus glycanilyticus]
MFLQKLPWAGIRVLSGETSIAIDPMYHFPAKFGSSHEELFPLDEFGHADAVFVTHHHEDHFDPKAIAAYYGASIPVYVPQESVRHMTDTPLTNIQGVSLGQQIEVGELTITAGFSVDGFGDPQVSWIVEGGGKKLIHSGDTLWHGYWWKLSKAYGPFDAACLPVNGAVVEFPGMIPSGQPITLTPEQAVAAAVVLQAHVLVPIHFRAVHHPPVYRETPEIAERLQQSAQDRIKLAILQSKEILPL